MSKYFFSVLFLFMAGLAHAQKQKMNPDLSDYKHRITVMDHILVFQLQPSDQQLPTVDIKKKYYWYSNNQIKITQGGFSGKLLHGSYSDFYFNNNLKEQGQFEMGLKVGEWKSWTIQGLLAEHTNFKKGILNGEFYRYNGLGVLSESGYYKNGNLHGKLTKYFEKDSLSITKYKDGVIDTVAKGQSWFKKIFKKKTKAQLTPK